MPAQGLQQAVSTLATAAATLPWSLTENFMSMREGRAVLAVAGSGGPLKEESGYSFQRDAVRKVSLISYLAVHASTQQLKSLQRVDLDA